MVGHRSPDTGREWWMAPGGLVNVGEPVVEAAVREVKEETGIDVEIGDLIYWVEWISDRSYCLELYFLGEVTGGALKAGSDPELDQEQQLIFDARFLHMDELRQYPVYPIAFRTMLAKHLRNGFPKCALYLGAEEPDLPR